MADYDISKAFETIENELIDSMMRNFKHHRAEEEKEGYNWSQWQSEQLKSLEQYRRTNQKKYGKQFSTLNKKIEEMLKTAMADGNAKQEAEILKAIKKGFNVGKVGPSATGEFFKVNDRKLDALINATKSDMEKAETAILRMSNDKYRKAIFNAQVYANSGAGTYEKAVDMAVKDMLQAGLNCVEYRNGARHTLSDYADMAIRTANKRAYLYGEGQKRQEWGISLVVVNSRQGGCPDCAQYIGRVFIDDVYSGGSKADGNYPLLSEAIAGGLFHPRCKDSTSTYYEGITSLEPVSNEELAKMEERETLETKQQNAERQEKRYNRLSQHSLDEDNKIKYQNRADDWHTSNEEYKEKLDEIIENSSESGIIKNIELPPETDSIRTMSESTYHLISKAIDDIMSDYNVQLDELVAMPLSADETNVPFQFQPIRGSNGDLIKRLVINTNYDFMSTQEDFQCRIMRNYNRGSLTSNSIEGLIAHEMAHIMTFQDVETYTGYLIRNKEIAKRFVYGISDYADASLDGAECIAEAFASLRCGGKISSEAQQLIDEFIERWKK